MKPKTLAFVLAFAFAAFAIPATHVQLRGASARGTFDVPLPPNPIADVPLPPNPVADVPLPPNPVADVPLPPNPASDVPLPPNPVSA